MRRPLLLLLIVPALVLAACGEDDDPAPAAGGGGASSSVDTTPAETTPAETQTEPADRGPDEPAVDGECREVAQPAPGAAPSLKAPTARLKRDATYDVVMTTSCGEFTIRLDQRENPKTAASFAALAGEGFFDGLTFHRVVPEFVIQGGDPAGDGSGGPGYSVEEAPPEDQTYTEGVVAMAKTGAEAPGTSGSQFFVVVGADVGLPPEYAVAGEVTDGMETVDAIAALGASDGPPSQPVMIEKAELETS